MRQAIRPIRKLLVANRGEIAIRIFRACTELGIRTVAIYTEQDRLALHRFKADEAYLIGQGKGPVEAYLDIDGIIALALQHEADAIHPGYGFLAENATLARRCAEAGILFVGPRPEHIEQFGDKLTARRLAAQAGLPIVPGSDGPVATLAEAQAFAKAHGYPLIVKAAAGGGGRGMRIVQGPQALPEAFERARSEARAAFGDGSVYLERYLERPKHVEVQVVADAHGQVVHLFERDCSIQRRHQKVVEVAPCRSLSETQRDAICQAAVRLLTHAGYVNVGTVEFLVLPDGSFYFIEVNPRIQVEHTITELITGIDLVQTQIRIAEGYRLADEAIGIPNQAAVQRRGYAIQCRITTEDPEAGFTPAAGRLLAYRSAGGFGVRLDAGNAAPGAIIVPYYDSLLVKVSTYATTFPQAASKMLRALREFRIRGIKTNIPFLENVVQHPDFLAGEYDTSFIDTHKELFQFAERQDRGTKLLTYIGEIVVNGYPGVAGAAPATLSAQPRLPQVPANMPAPEGTRAILQREGPEGLARWVRAQKRLLVTDTTFRDAHQSLLATRVRTFDLLRNAEAMSKLGAQFFSLEMWGGATFDTSMRFLNEDPWERLVQLREKIPNLLFQMLFRGANAVGYGHYPDNVIRRFIAAAAQAGIDIFRIFDSLNQVDRMRVAIDAAREAGRVAEAAICYTGDILDPTRSKYDLKYYVRLAQELERAGAHILAIKDMAGLLKPQAGVVLIRALREETGLPIHLHTHDTSGNGVALLLKAAEAGVDIVDTALQAMAGLTSQPSGNALVYALQGSGRETGLDPNALQALSDYWEDVRRYYSAFESGLQSSNAEVYRHEMPGGQYSNLQQQALALGLGDRWQDIKEAYIAANRMFGDIVKVTPSSKVVGDFALFMVQNDLHDERDVLERGPRLDFPESVIRFFQGELGVPHGGFPQPLQEVVLKERPTSAPVTPPAAVDFDAARSDLQRTLGREISEFDLLSYLMYPKVFLEMERKRARFGDLSVLDTPTFFFGLTPGQEVAVEIERGKRLIIKLLSVGELQPDGMRTLYFELNGQPREIAVADASASGVTVRRHKADPAEPGEVGASMPGKVVQVRVHVGDAVKRGQPLLITEAMKMETAVQAPMAGTVLEVCAQLGEDVQPGDLLVRIGRG